MDINILWFPKRLVCRPNTSTSCNWWNFSWVSYLLQSHPIYRPFGLVVLCIDMDLVLRNYYSEYWITVYDHQSWSEPYLLTGSGHPSFLITVNRSHLTNTYSLKMYTLVLDLNTQWAGYKHYIIDSEKHIYIVVM